MAISVFYTASRLPGAQATRTHDDERIDKLAKAATGASDYTCHVEIYHRGLDALEVSPTARTLLLPGQMPPITSPFQDLKRTTLCQNLIRLIIGYYVVPEVFFLS